MIRIIFPLLLGVAALVSNAAAETTKLAADAPDSYVVQKGDTLWDISGRFLEKPWRWPEVWQLNKDQIRNPHLIYPGQVVYLDRNGPYLRLGSMVGTQKLSPKIYTESLDSAISSIPVEAIAPFLTQPLVVDDARIADSATIVAMQDSRVNAGAGDTIFAKNVTPAENKIWQVYRKAQPLKDPDSKEILGYEAEYLGNARVTADGTPATLKVTKSLKEIGTSDRMLLAEEPTVFAYVPHAPDNQVEGKLVSIYGGLAEAGRYSVVALNLGKREGMEVGHVLALYRHRGVVEYKGDGEKEKFLLPDRRYGLVFVFRVFDRVSYALVMDTDGSVVVGDRLRNP
jgi:hypothetical protein